LGLVVDYRFSGNVLGGLLLLLVMVVGAARVQATHLFVWWIFHPAHAHGTSSFLQLLGGDEQII
jgi:hypothetical protein